MSEKPLAVQLPGVADFTPTGLTLRKGLSCEAYMELGRTLLGIQRMAAVYLADFARQGVERLGENDARNCWAQLELELALPVASQMEMSLGIELPVPAARPDGLSDEHFLVAARECDDQAEMVHWLNVAREARLDARQLQLTIRAGELRRAVPTPAGTRISFGTVFQVESAWKSFAKVAKKPSELTADEAAEIAHALRPIVDYWRELEEVAGA